MRYPNCRREASKIGPSPLCFGQIALDVTDIQAAKKHPDTPSQRQNCSANVLHPRQMEGSFPQVSFQSGSDSPGSIEITKPLAMLRIRKILIRPLMDLMVPIRIFLPSCQLKCQQRGDDCLALRPPEFHIVPVLLNRVTMHISEVENPSIF